MTAVLTDHHDLLEDERADWSRPHPTAAARVARAEQLRIAHQLDAELTIVVDGEPHSPTLHVECLTRSPRATALVLAHLDEHTVPALERATGVPFLERHLRVSHDLSPLCPSRKV
ncbi:hypothetical protein C8046_02275 [Serinibacter arcticus]|uniref:Uncharacterized protein n=1 Tax=Serinibacter arcticus TaxID=1655435 RepID=A0A2U1ZRT8_9MICO|nr:hypothetical protein [Serinibacter arcticus]PWD49704.1 hypothetical protein C8046_02275 [Serinibacter arcticus]